MTHLELAAEAARINNKADRRRRFTWDSIDKELLDLYKDQPGFYIRHAAKSRLTKRRGQHYTVQDALAVAELLRISKDKLPFVTNQQGVSRDQWWRHGLAFLRENMDPTGVYAETGELITARIQAGRLVLYPKRGVVVVSGVKQSNVEFAEIVTWIDHSVTGEIFNVNNLTQEDIDALAHVATYDGEKLTRL